ncbi:MAG: IS66 family transposase [Comamonadaceae bacterium]|nr:IS66 family transposase [Comamonadaceae bacterium]
MQNLPDLAKLSHVQKDDLIRALWPLQSQVRELVTQMAVLQERINQLEGRLALNSKNSSKPPSSDGLNKPAPKSLRVAGRNPTGGQDGHPGRTLRQVTEPDKIITHNVPDNCPACHGKLAFAYVAETRQVFDLPVLQCEVTEHRVMQAICACGHVHTAEFPADVAARVQYGPRAQAAMVHLNLNHAVSVERTAALMKDLFDLPVSQATVIKAGQMGANLLKPSVEDIGQAVVKAEVAHADESGLRVAKTLHWLHVLATETLTWMGCHPKRGGEAFESLALLQLFKGVLVHDGWIPYKALECQHALCNQHHLRELTYLHEEQGQAWAGDMIELLSHANHLDNRNCADDKTPRYASVKYQSQVADLRDLYDAILAQAQTENPIEPATGKRGRPKQSKATNLIGRLRNYSDDVWRFMTQPNVPFTNNLAEQTVRMPKVKQKVSGCFRTPQGAKDYCVIRSYCATMHKQGANIFESLVAAFKGAPPQPSFA